MPEPILKIIGDRDINTIKRGLCPFCAACMAVLEEARYVYAYCETPGGGFTMITKQCRACKRIFEYEE